MNHSMRTLLVATALTFGGTRLHAQADIPYLAKGNVELNGFVGAAAGGGNTSLGAGGNLAVAVHRNVMPYVEYSYFPGSLGASLNVMNPIGGTNDVALATGKAARQDFHGGVHLRFPIGRSKIVPYAAFGVGALFISSAKGTIVVPVGNGTTRTFDTTLPSETETAVNFGGGIRIYTKENFGLRLEVKGYRPVSGNYVRDTFMKATVGFFWYSKK